MTEAFSNIPSGSRAAGLGDPPWPPHRWPLGNKHRARLLVITLAFATLSPVLKDLHPGSVSTPLPSPAILRQHADLLTALAGKYVWWLSPAEAMEYPARVVAQVMNIGLYEDACQMAKALGEDCLRAVLQHAEAGQFNARSWAFWHYRLGIAELDQVPPMPVRRIE